MSVQVSPDIDSSSSALPLELYFERLLDHLDLVGNHNPVAVITRYHWDRVLRLVSGEPLTPLVWEINPSGICNIHCSFCLYPDTNKVLMPKTHFFHLVAQAKEMGARAIIIAGDGEPLVHPDIEEMFYTVRDAGLEIFLFSNGTLIGRRVSAATIVDTCTIVFWGLYSSTAERYKQLTGSDKFDQVVRNISDVAEARNRTAGGKPKPVLIGGWVATGSNYDEAEAVAHLGQRMGLDWVYLRTDVTAESFNSARQVEELHASLRKLKYERFASNPDFIQARLLFDRRPSFATDELGPAVALLYPGAESWPMHDSWLSWNDILYVGPNGDLRVSNRKEVSSGLNKPFVLGSTLKQDLSDSLHAGTPVEQMDIGNQIVGQTSGRKALCNLFYNLVQKMGDAQREELRSRILERYPRTIYSDTVSNYF